MNKETLKKLFDDYYYLPNNKIAINSFIEFCIINEEKLLKIKSIVKRFMVAIDCFEKQIKLESYKDINFASLKDVKDVKKALKEIEVNKEFAHYEASKVPASYVKNHILIKDKWYKKNNKLAKYSEHLSKNGIKYLKDENFIYIPLLNSLYSEDKDIFFLSSSNFYGYLMPSNLQYYELIRQKYAQHINLAENGLLGFTYPVPMMSLNKEGNTSLKLSSFIEEMYKDVIEEFKDEVSNFGFSLNQNMEQDWNFHVSFLSEPLDISGYKKKYLNDVKNEIKKFADLTSLNSDDGTFILKYDHYHSTEIEAMSAKALSKNNVLDIEVHGVTNYLKKFIKNISFNNNISLRRNELTQINKDKYSITDGSVVYISYTDLVLYSQDIHPENNLKKGVELLQNIEQEHNCQIVIVNFEGIKNSQNVRLFKMKKGS